MTDDSSGPIEEQPTSRVPRDPAGTLRLALAVYVAVDLALGIPLAIAPVGFLELIGVEDVVAAELGGLRWVGASLVAWGIGGVLVYARPVGRAYFVTVGALQLSLASIAMLYSTWTGDSLGSGWFQGLAILVFVLSAAFLSWARLRARGVLSADLAP